MVVTAESCTGGMIAAALTDVPGSSAVVERGFVTYSNEAKSEMLGLSIALIEKHGAVSGEVAGAMATGAIQHSRASLAVSVTGIAGPTGLVWFGLADRNGLIRVERRVFSGGSRAFVRKKATQTALRLVLNAVGGVIRY